MNGKINSIKNNSNKKVDKFYSIIKKIGEPKALPFSLTNYVFNLTILFLQLMCICGDVQSHIN